MLKIGEFSKLSHLTVKALRFYEKEGLIIPASVDKFTGYRLYETYQLKDAAKNKPEIVDVQKTNYIAVRGKGNPNIEGGAYQRAIGVLYAVAYTLKMSYKTDYKIEGFFDIIARIKK